MISIPNLVVPDCIKDLNLDIYRQIKASFYEAEEIRVACSVFGSNDVVIDLGSGIGVTAVCLLKSGVSRVHCYEADPTLVECSKLFLEANGEDSSIVVNSAIVPLGDENLVKFFVRQPFIASSILREDGDGSECINVPSALLDEEVLACGANSILCDIEGAEAVVLANSTLPGVKKLVIEVHAHKSGVENMAQMFNRLSELGFVYDQWYSIGRVIAFRHKSIYFNDYFEKFGAT